jgi:DNA-binding NtrC family response regulator
MDPRVLVVDDDRRALDGLARGLKLEGYEIHMANNGREALEHINRTEVDVVVTDLKMPQVDGLQLLSSIKNDNPDTIVIIMTAFATVEKAVEAIKAGAYDFLTKPINLDHLSHMIQNALEHRKLKREIIYLRRRLKEASPLEQMIGESREMHKLFEIIHQVGPTDATVLIQGESGTGKELVANAIHALSPRADMPFIKFNCATLSEGVIESELFGHERGAFTGAHQLHKGRFELANDGTLFIDEVGEMSIATQVKFLRVLQEQEFERVGGAKTLKVDFRLIVATNQDLEEAVYQKDFRQDLFYRLNVLRIAIPPLRQRAEDIPPLVDHYMKVFNEKHGKHVEGISTAAMKRLMAYSWPGNVREVMNCLENMVLMSRQPVLQEEDLPIAVAAVSDDEMPSFEVDALMPLQDIERKAILQTLQAVGGNKHKAARILGIGVKTLYRKLEKYGTAT